MSSETVPSPQLARRRVRWSCVIALAPFLLPAWFVWRKTEHLRLNVFGTRFDPDAWRAASGKPFLDCTRWHMVESLRARHRLVGRTAGEVGQLLGPPDEDPYLLVEQPQHRGSYIYRLGPDHLGLDSMWLVIGFDAESRVSGAKVVSD